MTYELKHVAGKSLLYVMAVDAEYGEHLRTGISPLMTGVGPVEAAVQVARALAHLEASGNLPDLVVARQVLSPLDLERMFGLTEGDIFHGRHDLDQIFSLRPHPQAAQYGTPIDGLYLCGSGTHPGGGVSGAPGRNAAMKIIADLKGGRAAKRAAARSRAAS